jgi:hypothetical protein
LIYIVEVELVDFTTHVLDFVDEVKDGFVITIKITSDLSGRLRSHLLDDVEHLFESEAMLAENRVCEIVKVRLAVLTPVLLSVFACGSSLDNLVTSAVKTRHRLAETGETEAFKTSLTWWNEDLSRLFVHR